MNKTTLLLLGLLVLSSCVFAQTEDEEIVEAVQEEQGEVGDAERAQAEADPMQDEAFRDRIRDLYVACIVTSRQKLTTYGDDLVQLVRNSVQSQEEKARPPLYQKILAEHIMSCAQYSMQNPSAPQDIIKSLQERTFDMTQWEIMFMTLDFKKYAEPDFSVELNEDEQGILQFVDQFDEAMKQNRKEQGIEDDDEALPGFGTRQQSYEPKIGGFSLNSLPKGVSALYLLAILGALGAAIYYGYSKTDINEPEIKVKTKKNKQKSS